MNKKLLKKIANCARVVTKIAEDWNRSGVEDDIVLDALLRNGDALNDEILNLVTKEIKE